MVKLIANKNIKENNKKNASSLLYFIIMFVIFLAFAAFAVDGTVVLTNRAKLQNITEMTALAAASEFRSSSSVTANDIDDAARNTFNLLKQDGLGVSTIDVKSSTDSNKVFVKTTMISQPFFLAFLGVSGITLEAQACAVSEELNVQPEYGHINWITVSAAYKSDILSKSDSMRDSAILTPLGDFKSASIDSFTNAANFSLINSTEDKPLSLGPGGFVTIKLPAPIIDKPGPDLYIQESGALEGYMVFAGLDINPKNPYVNDSQKGEDIAWVNISDSGTSEYSALGARAKQYTNTNLASNSPKFYGCGYFDIGKSNISMAKYIRIVDDNCETAFVKGNDGNYYKATLYGEASTATPGADIYKVLVLNHVKLIPYDAATFYSKG